MDQEQINQMLFEIHTHAELCNPEEIVYKHSDILKIINEILEKQKSLTS